MAADLRRHLILINNDQTRSFLQRGPRRIHAARDHIVHLRYANRKRTNANSYRPRKQRERAAKLVAQMALDEKLGLVAGVAGIQYVPQMPPAPPEARGGDGFVDIEAVRFERILAYGEVPLRVARITMHTTLEAVAITNSWLTSSLYGGPHFR